MKTYLEYQDDKSHKFWQIEQTGNTHTVCYGKVGSDGRETVKTFDSKEEAKKDAQKQINAKKKKGYAEAKPPKVERKPVKIRQPLLENPLYDFEYEPNPPQNPTGVLMSFEEANAKYKIEGLFQNFTTKAFVLDGDVHFKSDAEVQQVITKALKNDSEMLIIVTGNLTVESWVSASLFSALMVCGDLRCDVVVSSDENYTLVKGSIYAKQAYYLQCNNTDFTCMGKVYTPYFLTDGGDINVSITLAEGYIGIEENSEAYESERDYKVHYTGKDYKTSFVYEVLDFGFELDTYKFIDYVASGKNPIREFERSKKEIKQDKRRKANDSLMSKIKNSDKTLDLSHSRLKELPELVCTLASLEALNVLGNDIKKLPKEISHLKNLRKLNVCGNSAINIDAICELEQLEVLNINSCADEQSFQLPLELGRLKNLKTLFADAGYYFANPEQIADLENLENLEIAWYYVWENARKYIPQIKAMKTLKRLAIYEKFSDKKNMETIKNTFSHCEIFFVREGQYYSPKSQKTIDLKALGLSLKEIEEKAKTDEDYKKLLQFGGIFEDS